MFSQLKSAWILGILCTWIPMSKAISHKSHYKSASVWKQPFTRATPDLFQSPNIIQDVGSDSEVWFLDCQQQQCCNALPSQALPSGVGMKPMSHSQRKPPGRFRQWPLSHRLPFSAHSSLSVNGDETHTFCKHTIHVFFGRDFCIQVYWFVGMTWAVESISGESLLARTSIRAHGVETVSVVVAHVCPIGALVQVWNMTKSKSNIMNM